MMGVEECGLKRLHATLYKLLILMQMTNDFIEPFATTMQVLHSFQHSCVSRVGGDGFHFAAQGPAHHGLLLVLMCLKRRIRGLQRRGFEVPMSTGPSARGSVSYTPRKRKTAPRTKDAALPKENTAVR
jgi:hypothetical protein